MLGEYFSISGLRKWFLISPAQLSDKPPTTVQKNSFIRTVFLNYLFFVCLFLYFEAGSLYTACFGNSYADKAVSAT